MLKTSHWYRQDLCCKQHCATLNPTTANNALLCYCNCIFIELYGTLDVVYYGKELFAQCFCSVQQCISVWFGKVERTTNQLAECFLSRKCNYFKKQPPGPVFPLPAMHSFYFCLFLH